MEPSPEDWLKVGNDIRMVLNDMRAVLGKPPVPLVAHAERVPTEEELAEWDDLIPGGSDTIRKMARREMEHRIRMERLRAENRSLIQIIRSRLGRAK